MMVARLISSLCGWDVDSSVAYIFLNENERTFGVWFNTIVSNPNRLLILKKK